MADVERVARPIADGVVYIVHLPLTPGGEVNDVVGRALTMADGPHSA